MKTWMLVLVSSLVTVIMFSFSPIIMIMAILMMTMILCFNIYWMFSLSIFSYMMFLIFMGGLLILFTYMCSIASNEKQVKSKYMKILILISMILSIFLWAVMESMNLNISHKLMFTSFIKLMILNTEMIYLFIFIYLLMTLFVAVQLSKKKEGSVRMKKS